MAIVAIAFFVLNKTIGQPSTTELPPRQSSQISRVTITTDKTEYRQGENIKITLSNESDQSMWHYESCGGAPFWGLQKFDNGMWNGRDIYFPSLEREEISCVLVLCEETPPVELRPGSAIYDVWPSTKTCDWPKKPIGTPEAEPKFIEEGTYRVYIHYSLEADFSEYKTIYSNEFKIIGD